jgi:hypothetical protein
MDNEHADTTEDPQTEAVEAPDEEAVSSGDAHQTDATVEAPPEAEPEPEALEAEQVAGGEPEATAELAEEPEPEPEPTAGEVAAAEEPEVEPDAAPDDAQPAAAEPGVHRVPWWPFLVYLTLWAGLVGASVYVLGGAQSKTPPVLAEPYPYVVLGGLVLTALGPILAVIAWFVIRARAPKGSRGGLFVSTLLRGSAATMIGVVAWWASLVVLDALRLGLIRF